MTYIKPETVTNQSLTSVEKILQQGLAAAQQEDWLLVDNYLKLLPQTTDQNKAKEFVLNQADWQKAFDLAVSMLIKADFQHKWAVAKLLPLFGEKIIPNLTTLVRNSTTPGDVRWFICKILGNFNHPTVILTLVELLDSTTDRELVSIAGKTLTEIGDDAVDTLEDLLSKPQHRLLAVQSLYYIRTAQTIEPLLKVAVDSQSELRAIAIKALGSFHDSRIPPVLVNALQDKASKVRQQAAIALGFRADLCDRLSLIDRLSPLLLDLDLEVCHQAAVSLSRMKREKATKALFDVLKADTTPVSLKLELVKALGWSEISSAINYLEKALSASTAVVTEEIITVLGRTTIDKLKSQAAQVLVSFWQSQNPQLKLPQLKQTLATSLERITVWME